MLGLQKIVLHNSYFKGKTVAIPCNGHTNNSGGNGAGKSSALNLIPIFYGESPETVNDRAGQKLSFLDFYLPTSASLIAFEYEREDGSRCAILYRHPAGKVAYRFVSGKFQDTFFKEDLKEKLLNGLPISDAINELKVENVPVTRQIINITEYRSIIQQNEASVRKAAKTRKGIRAEVKEYCLGGANSHMIHMDRLTFSILKRNSMFKRLKKMIVDTMFGEINIEDKPAHDRNQYLIDEIRSVRNFSNNENDIRTCVRQSADRMQVQVNIGKYAKNLHSLVEEKEIDIRRQEVLLEEQVETFQKDEMAFNLQVQDIESSCQSTDLKRKAITKRVTGIYAKKSEWDEAGIRDKISLYDCLNMYVDQKNDAKIHYDSLLDKVKDIESEKKSREASVESSYQREKSNISAKIFDLEKRKLRSEIEFKDESAQISNNKETEVKEEEASFLKERDRYQEEKITQLSKVESISETPEEKAQLEFIQTSMDDAQEKIDEIDLKIKRVRTEKDGYQAKLDESLRHIKFKRRDLERHYDVCDEIKSRLYPEENTLLSVLRKHDAGWGEKIGKIINPSLLHSKNLSPVYKGESDGLAFGWELDISGLPVSPAAESEELLIARLEKQERMCEACKKDISDLETTSNKISDSIKEVDGEIGRFEFDKSQAKSDLEALKRNRTEVKNNIREAVLERKLAAQKILKEKEKELDEFVKRHESLIKSINERYSELQREALGRHSMLISDIESDVESKKEMLIDIEHTKSEKLRQIGEVFNEKYQKEGIDEIHIKEAEKAYKDLEEKVSRISKSVFEIERFRVWEEQEWDSLKELEDEEKELSGQFERFSNKLKEIRSKFKSKKEEHLRQVALCERELKDCRSDVSESKALLKSLGSFPGNEAFDHKEMRFVREKLFSLREEQVELRNKILTSVNAARQIVTSSPESQIAKAWSQLEEIRVRNTGLRPHDPEFLLQQPVDLETLIESNLPQIRKALLETVINIGGGINNYYLTLKQLTAQIKRVSSELGRKINTDQKIDNLKDIKILLTSRIEEEACWVSLIRFSTEWESWNINRDDKLPPESLIGSLKEALDTLSVARITNDIGSLVDLNLSMIENNRPVTIRSDSDFDRVSSNGLSYLAICVVFLGMSRYLCPDTSVKLTWPVDELAALSPKNISKLFDMLDSANIAMFSAFPSQDTNLLKFFENKNLLDLESGVRAIKVSEKFDKNSLKEQILGLSQRG